MLLPFSRIDGAELCTFNHADAMHGQVQVTARAAASTFKGLFCQSRSEGLRIEVLHQGRTIAIRVYEE